jgi:hypothetical protein
MPKNSSIDVLRRWMDLDLLLDEGDYPFSGLYIASFAEKWGVSVKTVRRDLDDFKEMGQKMRHFYEWDSRRWLWCYLPQTRPLFTKTDLRRRRGSGYAGRR